MEGKGKFVWKNGQKYTGMYKRDRKNGKGVLELSDGTVVEGTWVDGKLHGKGMVTNAKGRKK
jgi:hypothetical protein